MNTSQYLRAKHIYFLTLLFITINIYSQNIMNVGKASYAEFPPQGAENQSAYRYSYKELKEKYPFYLHENAQGQPVPTNDWWTDAIFSQYAGDLWAYPHGVSADSAGINIVYPDGFEGGRLSKNNYLKVLGTTNNKNQVFKPHSAKPINWGDLHMQFRCEDEQSNFIDVTVSHGSPFVWIDLNGIIPVIAPSGKSTIYNANGAAIDNFPVKGNMFSLQIGEKYYGVHLPVGTTINNNEGNYFVDVPEGKNYLVISVLPDHLFLETFDTHARNKLISSNFEYNYSVEKGQISTSFLVKTENLNTKAIGSTTLMALLPHHYRNSESIEFIEGADYKIHLGKMRTAVASEFTSNYNFTGLPPHLGKPQHMTLKQKERLNLMVSNFKLSKYGINTYNKNLDELSEIMLIAREIDHDKYEKIKETLKQKLTNWLTYEESEGADTGLYFAQYPQYGALIGFSAGFDSQAFNDQHFHYGYYVLAASRLMMVDEGFKKDYAEMVKLIAKNYANWERWDGVNLEQKLPYLRTFDPYVGHSWASGLSYATGPDQESTSEAIMSWFGLFNLGLVLNDAELIALGATGYTLESESTLEYYFNFYGDNFPETYTHKYVGILHAGALMHDTWFSRDPAWIFGIQSVPSAHYCSYLARDKKQSETIMMSAIQERVSAGFIDTTDLYTNILSMGKELGYYITGYYANFKPKEALLMQDKLFENETDEWKWNSQATINYHLTNALISFGMPAKGYHTSLPAGTVYENNDGIITYILYNHTQSDKEVKIFKNNKVIDNVIVKAGKFYYGNPNK